MIGENYEAATTTILFTAALCRVIHGPIKLIWVLVSHELKELETHTRQIFVKYSFPMYFTLAFDCRNILSIPRGKVKIKLAWALFELRINRVGTNTG